MAWLLVVPGRSDKLFWKVLKTRGLIPSVHRVVDTNGDDRLVRDAAKLERTWERLGHTALFVRDLESPSQFPCIRALLDRFDAAQHRRIVIAKRCLEAWFLADDVAINQVLPQAQWEAPPDADTLQDPVGRLKELFRRAFPGRNINYGKTDFASKIAEHFDLDRAAQRSASLRRLVERLCLGEE